MMTCREQAVETLLKINREGAFSNLETREVLSRSLFSKEDKGLYIAIVYGTLQNQQYLDYILSQVVSKPLNQVDAFVLTVLRTAVYQLRFMNRVPDYAVVDEAVKITSQHLNRARGFVNGVLRNILRQKDNVFEFDMEQWENEKEAIAIRYSIPQWIVHKYFEAFGPEKAMMLLPQMNDTPPFTIRTNTLVTNREALSVELSEMGIDVRPGELCPEALHLESTGNIGADLRHHPLFKSGQFTVQDQGAMLVARLLDPKPGELVLDMCAAPGGKTTHLAQLMNNQGTIIARDVYDSRLKLVKNSARRLKIDSIVTEKVDGTRLNPLDLKAYDRILLDAPCTGTGIIRRKPEIRYHGDKKTRKEIRRLQSALLENAADMLVDGGVLVYSTCAVNSDENEKQIQTLLQKRPNLQVVSGTMGYSDLTMDGCDCFFHCKLIKN